MNDTIAAIATPPGNGALAIVRASGPDAGVVLERVFVPDSSEDWAPRTVRHGRLLEIDDGLAWWASGPATFTGEDVAEFTGHGGAFVAARVLDAFLAAGARLAQPGEFTRRAFLNGKMDLARAEAVADVIAASTDDALRAARAQLAGGLSERILEMREVVLDALAHVEATVDFPDEDLHPDGNARIAELFDGVAAECARLIATFRRGRLLREGARVVLVGRPNVGKSSLLNALAGRARAIVTAQPGTTRDVVEESIEIEGIPVVLADTAGLREIADGEVGGAGEVEAEGVRRSRAAAADADLVLVVYDAAAGFGAEDRLIAGEVAARPAVLIANKADLVGQGSQRALPPTPSRWEGGNAAAVGGIADLASVRVSALSGAGLDELRIAMRDRLVGSRTSDSDLVVTRVRHREALEAARGLLSTAASAARRQASPDLIASDARRAMDALGEIVGAVSTEDLLGRIFERFCVGK